MGQEFDGKVVLVTGAGSGIGRGIALAFAREGARCIVSDLNSEAGEETVQIVNDLGGTAAFIQADVTRESEVMATVKFCMNSFGRLDCACNNAGVAFADKPLTECTEEEWDRTININLKSVWLCMKHQIPELLKQPGSAIVNTASVVALATPGLVSPYTASKHGVVGLTKSAAVEYAPQGLRVNAICPGITKTPLLNAAPEFLDALAEHVPAKRLGQPDEMADAAVWLCSEKSKFVTGHALVIDGGYSVI